MLNFYMQLLTGDSTDNIPGLKGVGPKTAEKVLANCTTEEELYAAVLICYINHKPFMDYPREDIEDMIVRNARLLWIRKEEGELWQPPK